MLPGPTMAAGTLAVLMAASVRPAFPGPEPHVPLTGTTRTRRQE